MKTTKDRRKKIQLNGKIKYFTRLQKKKLNQQDLAKIEAEKQEIKNIKTKVNRQLKININAKTPDSSESLINLIVPSTKEKSIKILNDKRRKNWCESLTERKKNKKSKKSNYQLFLEINKKCFNIPLDDIYLLIFIITYMGKGLNLPKTYSGITTKFRLSLPIIYFKNIKKKVLKKLDLPLNELSYSKLAKTKQDSPADKLYFKAENASFSYSNLVELIDKPCSQLETFFNFTVTERNNYLKTYSRKNLKKKLSLLKSYSRVIVQSKNFLLRTFSNKNIRDQKYILEIYNTLFKVIIEEKCIKNASNINSCVITRSGQVNRIAYEDNTEQLNHNQSSSDTTHLIGSDSCLCVDCCKAMKKRTSLKNLKKCACIITTCEKNVSHGFSSKWMNTLKSLLLINKINIRVQTNEEKATHKIPVCNEHYEQILLIAQCQLCGNRGLEKFHLDKSEVHKYQSVLNEDEIPVTIKYDILICKPCHIYLLLRRDKTTKMSFELEKHCDASRIRIINHNLKSEINIKKTEEYEQLLLVKSLPMKKRNIYTSDSSMVLKPVSSAIEFVNTTTTVITTTIGTKPLMTTRTMTMAPMSTVLTIATENLSPLGFNQKPEPTFLDTHPSVPRTIKRPVTTNYRKHSMTVHKLTIPDHRITIPVEKPVSPIDRVDRSMTQVDKSMTQIKKTKTQTSKPMIPVDRSTTLVNKSTISVDKSMITNHKKKIVFTPVLRSIFTSELSVPKEHVKTSNSVSPLKVPTIVQTDQSLNNSLDSRFKSPLTEFPKSSRQQASKCSSTTPDIIQFYKNLKTTYPNGEAFINNLMKLETCRNLGYFTVQ